MLVRIRRALSDAALNVRTRILPVAKVGGVRLPIDTRLSLQMRRTIVNGKYERHELRIVARTLSTDDRVLECGAGIGLLASYCAKRIGSDRVKTFEANPHMGDIIKETFALNGVSPTLISGAIGAHAGTLDLHVAENFWASSSHAGRAEGSLKTISVPMYGLHAEIVASQPTYLFIDIEGGEEHLANCSSLPGVRKVMAEVHPDLIGEAGVARFTDWLQGLGLVKDAQLSTQRELFFARG